MKKYFLMGLFFFSLVSCQREIDKYYEIPDWLKGNAYERWIGVVMQAW